MRQCNDNGLTLAELLITTMVIGIIMIGMVSVDYALRFSEQEQTRTSLATLRTSAALQDIATAAAQAYGVARCTGMPFTGSRRDEPVPAALAGFA